MPLIKCSFLASGFALLVVTPAQANAISTQPLQQQITKQSSQLIQLARANRARATVPRRATSAVRSRAPVTTQPVRRTTPAQKKAVVRKNTTVVNRNVRVVNGRRLVPFVAGAAIAAGSYCYVTSYGDGSITNNQCCIGGSCYSNFMVGE